MHTTSPALRLAAGWLPSLLVCLPLCGCGTATTDPPASATDSCMGGALSAATYDLSRSKFAFGSTPSRVDDGGMTRWVGADGVVAIYPSGRERGIPNAWADGVSVPDWSTDTVALSKHVTDYFRSMGAEDCQIDSAGVNTQVSNGGPTDSPAQVNRYIALRRALDSIPILDSIAWARFNLDDQSTSESLFWPAIPEQVVTNARTFRDRLQDPAALDAYRAKLPAEARGDGLVVIRHSSGRGTVPVEAWAVWEVFVDNPMGMGAERDFDENGQPVAAPM